MNDEFLTPRHRRPAALRSRYWLVGLGLAVVCLAASAGLSVAKWPLPRVHDEFSYLLAGDTFTSGRLTNPTHPYWQHFETFHVIHQPTYASKYPPGQGVILALGQWLGREPLAGVWLVSALAAAATYWMLLGVVPPRFAFLGSVLWLANAKYQIAWGQSYWGGTLAYLGGALVFGAALRLVRTPRVRDATAMSAGALALAATRPFEGLIYCAAVGVWLVVRWARQEAPRPREVILKAILPQLVLLGVGLSGLAVYHQAVTGDPLTFPYSVHEAAYGQCPLFVGQSPAPKPDYRHQALDDFHSGWELDWYRRQSTVRGWINTKFAMIAAIAEFFFPSFLAACALLARPLRWPRLRPVVAIAAVTLLASLAATWNLAHYLAPLGPLFLVVSVAGLRRADALSRRRLRGFSLAPALVGLQILLFAIVAWRTAATPQTGWHVERARILERLNHDSTRHLVLVKYGSEHNPLEEWVYNEAEIDGAQVVWARSMGAARDAELLDYFSDRQVWLLEPEAQRMTPLSREEGRCNQRDAGAPVASTQ